MQDLPKNGTPLRPSLDLDFLVWCVTLLIRGGVLQTGIHSKWLVNLLVMQLALGPAASAQTAGKAASPSDNATKQTSVEEKPLEKSAEDAEDQKNAFGRSEEAATPLLFHPKSRTGNR
jgi:hypothetical protein